MEELKLALLGGAQVTLGGKPLTGFVSNKCQALLFYLAVTGRPHLRPSLAALLWGDLPDEDASSNLRKSLTNLRHLLDPYLLITRHTVEFNLNSPYWLDVTAFEKGVSEVQGTQGTKGTALNSPNSPNSFNSLHEVVELYHGEFLAGFNVRDALPFEEWVVVERERLREQALSALDALALRSVDSGNYGEAIHYTTRLLALDPWREEAHRRLMLLLARTGQRPAALAQYETCRRLL
ncbi:MAG: bacterial transcriptional activator domain-containing protein, partial [Chloroflexota bacterium]